jgi:hypothetical protein
MDKLEHSVGLLKKVLNSEIFLERYPIIKRVEVDPTGRSSLTIVLIYDESKNYWDQRSEIHSFIWDIGKMLGISNDIYMYTLP